MEILGYTEQVNAAIGIVTTFDEDQLDKDLNDEIEKFSNLLNKAYRLKQRNNIAKGIITQANSNTQSGILKLEKNKKKMLTKLMKIINNLRLSLLIFRRKNMISKLKFLNYIID